VGVGIATGTALALAVKYRIRRSSDEAILFINSSILQQEVHR
jgi:hypothetical protein